MQRQLSYFVFLIVCACANEQAGSQEQRVREVFSPDGKTVVVSDSNASPLDIDPRMGRNPPMDALGVLKLKQFAATLELTDDQEARIRDIEEFAKKLRREAYSGIKDVRTITPEFVRDTQKVIDDEVAAAVRDVLMPHQLKRLKQTVRQMSVQSNGLAAVAVGDLAAELGLSVEQKETLRKRHIEVERELQKKLNMMRREEYLRAIKQNLSTEQFEKLKELLGPDVVYGPDFDPFPK